MTGYKFLFADVYYDKKIQISSASKEYSRKRKFHIQFRFRYYKRTL